MRLITVAAALGALLLVTPAFAELRVLGDGKTRTLDPSQFTDEERARYDIFKVRCTKCHEMNRPITAIITGVTPVTGSKFDQNEVKRYVVKMMRKPNSGISREDAKEVLVFLRRALELAGRGKPETPGGAESD